MGTRLTNTGKENNTVNTNNVWDRIVGLETKVVDVASETYVQEQIFNVNTGGSLEILNNKADKDYVDQKISEIDVSGSGLLSFNTLNDLQFTYPDGIVQPVWITSENSWYYWSGAILNDTTAPVLTITSGGLFTGTKTIVMSTNESATIYYTLDGTDPKTSGTKLIYSVPLSITTTKTVKAYAKDTANNESAVQTVTYTLDTTPDTTAPVLTITSGGTFTGTKTVTMSTDETATIYYTLDGSTPTALSSVYSSALSLTTTTTVKAFAKDSSGNISNIQTITYTLDVPADTTPPVLTITPSGTFTDTKTVTMSTNETASIYYTLDDTDPKTSGTKLTYSAPLTLTETDTVKAYAKDTANNESVVQTVTYTKQIPLSTIVSDDFNRADSTSSLGSATTGQAWTPADKTWGVIGNQAYMSTGTNGIAVIESGKADVEVSVKLPVVPTGAIVHNIVGRYSDNSNYYMIQNNGTGLLLYKKVANVYTQIGSTIPYTTLINDVMKVSLIGSTITVFMSDVQKAQWTDSTYTTQTKHGFIAGTTTCRFDDFIIKG